MEMKRGNSTSRCNCIEHLLLSTEAAATDRYYPCRKGQKRGAKARLLGTSPGRARGNPGRAESFQELIKKKCKSGTKQVKQLEILGLAIFC